MRVLIPPAIEQHLRRPIRFVVAVGVGNENELGGHADPHAAVPHFEAADEVQTFNEHGLLVERPVAIGVFKNQDAILRLIGGNLSRVRIGLRHPHRPRSSIAIAIGCLTSGSPANSDTEKPGGTVMDFAASTGDSPCFISPGLARPRIIRRWYRRYSSSVTSFVFCVNARSLVCCQQQCPADHRR